MTDISHQKQQTLQFPLLWHAHVIVMAEKHETGEAIEQVFTALSLPVCQITEGNFSSNGRYRTWQVSAEIPSLLLFRAVSKALGELPGVKMIL